MSILNYNIFTNRLICSSLLPILLGHFLPPCLVSTIFLSVGFVFPWLRSDFWFPASFILSRIFCNFFLWHEVFFNYNTPSGAAGVYAMSFFMHVFWLQKYFQGQRRRAQRKSTDAGTTMAERDGKGTNCPRSAVLSTATSSVSRTIHLRVKDKA